MIMSDQVIAVLDNLCAKFGLVIDWTSENVLPYVIELSQKFIKYEIATSVTMCVIIIALTIATYKLCRLAWTIYKKDTSDYGAEMLAICAVTICVIMLVIAISITICQTMDIVTCLTFPEKIIFEYVNTLLK